MIELGAKFRKVMVIDDNPIDLYIINKLIRNRNFANVVLTFNTAFEALAYLNKNKENLTELPEIVFVDIYMPVMSGFEFLDAFDQFPKAFKDCLRVFVVSSTIDHDDIERIESNRNVEAFGTKTISAEFLDSIKVSTK